MSSSETASTGAARIGTGAGVGGSITGSASASTSATRRSALPSVVGSSFTSTIAVVSPIASGFAASALASRLPSPSGTGGGAVTGGAVWARGGGATGGGGATARAVSVRGKAGIPALTGAMAATGTAVTAGTVGTVGALGAASPAAGRGSPIGGGLVGAFAGIEGRTNFWDALSGGGDDAVRMRPLSPGAARDGSGGATVSRSPATSPIATVCASAFDASIRPPGAGATGRGSAGTSAGRGATVGATGLSAMRARSSSPRSVLLGSSGSTKRIVMPMRPYSADGFADDETISASPSIITPPSRNVTAMRPRLPAGNGLAHGTNRPVRSV